MLEGKVLIIQTEKLKKRKTFYFSLAYVAQLVGHSPAERKVTCSISDQGNA